MSFIGGGIDTGRQVESTKSTVSSQVHWEHTKNINIILLQTKTWKIVFK